MRIRRMALVLLAAGAILAPAAVHAAAGTVAGDVGAAWKAARSALESDDWTIAEEDRAAGRIVTAPRNVDFRDFGLQARGTRERLIVTVRAAGAGLTSVTVDRELYREDRLLWDSVKHPIKPATEQVETAMLDSIALFMPAATVEIAPPPPSPGPTVVIVPPPATLPGATAPAVPPAHDAAATGARVPRVTYRVTGNSGPVQVTYRNAHGGNDAQTATLPWELTFDAVGATPLYVSAVAQGPAPLSVTCEILVDGAQRSQSMSVGSSSIATCKSASR
jgi:hypothetical protein